MTTRRTFLQSIVAALGLAPLLAKWKQSEVQWVTTDERDKGGSYYRSRALVQKGELRKYALQNFGVNPICATTDFGSHVVQRGERIVFYSAIDPRLEGISPKYFGLRSTPADCPNEEFLIA